MPHGDTAAASATFFCHFADAFTPAFFAMRYHGIAATIAPIISPPDAEAYAFERQLSLMPPF
jgi:hypothetical protein